MPFSYQLVDFCLYRRAKVGCEWTSSICSRRLAVAKYAVSFDTIGTTTKAKKKLQAQHSSQKMVLMQIA